MTTLYRDDLAAARIQRDELSARFRAELDDVLPSAGAVYVERVARSMAGVAAIGGAVVLAALTAWNGVMGVLGEPSFARMRYLHGPSGLLTLTLVGAWLAVGAAYVAGRRTARRSLAAFADAVAGTEGDDVHAALERLRAVPPPSRIREIAAARERSSVVYPLVGFLLLAPLGLHLLIYMLFRFLIGETTLRGAADYDLWIGYSLLIVGHCHVVAALLMRRFGIRLTAWSVGDLPLGGPPSLSVLGWTVLASLLPGLGLSLAKPAAGLLVGVALAVFVAITGAAVIPTSATWMSRRLLAERSALE